MSTIDEIQWFSTPLGQYLLEREQRFFDEAVSDIFGFNAIQIGLPFIEFLRASRIPLRATLAEQNARIVADCEHLPLASQSADLVVLPHVLEFARHPHQILREVERTLMPEGHLIISGFNPVSLWGLRRLLGGASRDFPWRGHFLALPRVKDWLALLNLEVMEGKLCCYAPPFSRGRWRERFAFMDAAGDRWWPLAGGVYFLVARKRVHGMRLITPQWNDSLAAKRRLAPAAQEPAANFEKRGKRESVV